jgi:polar amino acid transport system substrate-binding protein
MKGFFMFSRKLTVPALAAAVALSLAGCSTASSDASSTPTPSAIAVSVDSAAAALLPAAVAKAGKLNVGVGTDYPPNEYKDDAGNPTGWAVELVNAIAAKLGLTPNLEPAEFDKIIPSVIAGAYDLGEYSFTDNAEREQKVDFINYYNAGIQWISQAGKTVDPNNACGLKVAVFATSYQDTDEIPAKSKVCTDAGKPAIEVLKFDGQAGATNAVALGQADATSTDSPIAFAAIEASNGKLAAAGTTFEVAPYGFPIAKNSPLAPAIQKALQSLIDDGTYQKILAKYGVQDGAVTKASINAATNG